VTDHPSPFDEKAALAELDRLRDEIGAARQIRQKKSEEFDRFIQAFQPPPSPAAGHEIETHETPAAQPQQGSSPDTEHWLLVRERLLTPRAVPIVTNDSRMVATIFRRRGARDTFLAIAAAAIIVIALAVPGYRARTRPPSASPANVTAKPDVAPPRSPSTVAPPVTAAPAAALPSTAPSAPPAGTVRVDLRTVAPVWIRVVADDQKKVEAVIAAGERLSFTAERSIVVRAGNGGDVLVKTAAGEDPFGASGQALTRTFVVADRSLSPSR
jgi:hypothetical protein